MKMLMEGQLKKTKKKRSDHRVDVFNHLKRLCNLQRLNRQLKCCTMYDEELVLQSLAD